MYSRALMKLIIVFLSSFLLSGVVRAQDRATVRCPLTVNRKTALPSNARMLGQPGPKELPLWDAVPSLGSPADISDDRVLSDEGPDRDELQNGAQVQEWDIIPKSTDLPGEGESYMLACRYGITLGDARKVSATSVLVLLPLPASAMTCRVAHNARQGQPLKSAICVSTPTPVGQ